MVLKDWKQTTKNDARLVWVNQKSNRVLAVQDMRVMEHWNDDAHKGKWYVATAMMNDYADVLKQDISKSEALRIGMKYMRGH